MTTYSRIIGTGSYLPEKILTNQALEAFVDTTHEWIVERTGILQRHVAAEDERVSSMGVIAANEALKASHLSVNDIDLIVVGTSTPDQVFPSTASVIAKALGIKHCIAFDINAACAGFLYALNVVDTFVKSNPQVKNALVIGSEIMSRVIDWEDRSTCVLFGDGAGAVVLQRSDVPGILSTHLHADGQHADILVATGYRKTTPKPRMHMKGKEVFKCAVNNMGDLVEEVLKQNDIDKSEVDWLIPHQANMRIIASIAKKLNMPMSRVIQTVGEQGNTSSASVPLALDTGIRQGKIQKGDKILLEAFGAGFAWGAAYLIY